MHRAAGNGGELAKIRYVARAVFHRRRQFFLASRSRERPGIVVVAVGCVAPFGGKGAPAAGLGGIGSICALVRTFVSGGGNDRRVG